MPEIAEPTTVLAVDPGRSKCGVAVGIGPNDMQRLRLCVVETARLIPAMRELFDQFPRISAVVMGNGTNSATLRKAVQSAFPLISLHLVDEHGTSLMARTRYLTEHTPRGMGRLLPFGLRNPSVPIDDYVALILLEQFFSNISRY